MVIVLAKVRSVSCRRCFVVSVSNRPLIIWSRMFFLVQPLEQKLHVFTSSRRDTRKSSNASPTCCVHLRKVLRSTISLTCPSTYRLMARMIDSMLLFSYSVNPRFCTIDNVSWEKHNVSACTCFCASLLARPDRLMYESHCSFHAAKSVPRSTCGSNFGRSP